MKAVNLKLLLICLAGLVAWFLPPPASLSPEGWHLFIVFVLTIIGVITKAIAMGALCFLSMGVLTLTHTLTIEEALNSYGSYVTWLVLFAFCLARGFLSTGLGNRVAYFFVSLFGKSTLGLSYSFVISDLILSPAIPSNAARGGGVLFPIIKSLAEEFEDHTPEPGRHKRIGGFLIKVGFHANVITSAMFVTALAGNPLAVAFAGSLGIDIGWSRWALAMLVPGLFMLLLMPLIVYAVYPPGIKHLEGAQQLAKRKLKEMGPMSSQECIMLFVFIGLVTLWILGKVLGISATTAALGGIVALLLSGVLKWDDVIKEKEAWNTFIWFGCLISLAGHLEQKGVASWFASEVSSFIIFDNWAYTFLAGIVIYFYTHYFFASSTSLITSLFPAILHVMLKAGAPPVYAAISLAVLSTLSSGLTHYGTTPAPIYYSAGYVSTKQWWSIGALLSFFYLVTWLVLGTTWCRFVGLWY
jgi:DASS family divalent anion:Na+ symporter